MWGEDGRDERNRASQPAASPVRETKKLDTEAQAAAEFEREFFQKYPDLKPYRAITDKVADRVLASGWTGTRDEVMKRFADGAREEIARQQGATPTHADQTNAVTLGWRYENGSGVQQDYAKAAYWYRIAAERGDPVAQNNLGLLLHYGHGVQQDDVEAYAMFCVAAEKGCTNALDSRDSLAESLTPEQIADARKRADSYKARMFHF